MFNAVIITVSDSSFEGKREDLCAPLIEEFLKKADYNVIDKRVVPDEIDEICDALRSAVTIGANLVLTSGGTGFSKRDVTPEATGAVIEREAQGIAEAIRANSFKYTDRAMLSRARAGIVGDCLIINLPGSPKAVRETLEFLLPTLHHGLDILMGKSSNCARKD